jgi:hypothetical protein
VAGFWELKDAGGNADLLRTKKSICFVSEVATHERRHWHYERKGNIFIYGLTLKGVAPKLFPEGPPRVEYELTGLGKSLLAPTQALLDWGGNNWPDIKKVRGSCDERGP